MNELVEVFGSVQSVILFITLAVWSLIWKMFGAWKAARDGAKIWYIIMLLINTCGIVEIIYIFLISKRKK